MASDSPFPKGSLAVVALPLGNPDDITLRALEVLRAADRIAAEDTRTASRLLARHGIGVPLISYHDWNEAERTHLLLRHVTAGERVALMSEAGTPGISDPGYEVVRQARQQGLRVFPVPGASALTAFLSVCGLPTNAFSFFGFPPNRRGRRRELFHGLAERRETLVFYESPRRVAAALEDALWAFGERECALGREMTKTHEEFLFGPLSEIAAALASRPRVLGEVCWGIRGVEAGRRTAQVPLDQALAAALKKGLRPRDAAREAASLAGVSPKEAYTALTAFKRGTES